MNENKTYVELLDGFIRLVLIPILPIVSAYIVFLMKTLIERNKNQIENETQKKYLEMIEKIIEKVVIATAQTFVDSLKKQGKFDLEASKIAFKKTKEEILNLLTDDMKIFIKSMFGDLDLWLNSTIEEMVRKNKELPKTDTISDQKEDKKI